MKAVLFTILLLISQLCFAQAVPDVADNLPDHPRLLWLKGEEAAIQKNIQTDENWRKIHEAIITEANAMIPLPTLERIQIGRRLLDKSREALRRMLFLSYAYRMTDDAKYANRAEKELLKVANFSDWNPSHFLDVAEMTLAVSIGYDWLFDVLPENSKKLIRAAIKSKGIEPSYGEYNWFLKATHNWNQVCNAGMTFGSLAIYEHEPELAYKTIVRSVESIKLPMEDYQPSGAYPEGPGYWIYGTSFNVFFLNAIEKIYGDNFGLTEAPGFLETGEYALHVMGTTDFPFNYSDAGGRKEGLNPTIFWFADRTKDASLIYGKDKLVNAGDLNVNDRIFPMVMIWGKDLPLRNIPTSQKLFWQGDGKNPVAFMRSGWSENDIYVGFKGGAAQVNHGHMDVGSFVMDALGERWGIDLGMQSYESLESKGIKLWDKAQNGQRWEILRYNNRYHNTLTFDDELQLVDGKAEIISKSDKPNFMSAVMDMTPVYANKVKTVKRGVALLDKSIVVIKDEITTGNKPTKMQWTMVTPADAVLGDSNTITLTQNGKSVTLRVISPQKIALKSWSTDPVHSYDAENPGTIRVGFEVALDANQSYDFSVLLLPEVSKKKIKVNKLADWK